MNKSNTLWIRIYLILAALGCVVMAKSAENPYLEQMRKQSEASMTAFDEVDYFVNQGKDDSKVSKLAIGLEPYGTISWQGINGESDLGAGVSLVAGVTKNLSIVVFAEGDSVQGGNFFDDIARSGAGLRYTAWLGSRISLDGGVAGAYDIHNENFFLRLPLGASAFVIKEKNYDLGIRLQYAFDISGDGPNGSSTGRAFAGPVFNLRF